MLFEVLLRQSYLGKPALNRWFYNSSGTPAAVSLSFALAFALGFIPDGTPAVYPTTGLFWKLVQLQSTELAYVELEVEALYDVEDFYTVPFPGGANGQAEGVSMARYEAYAVRSNRVRTDVRRGQKRFASVIEENVTTGGELVGDGVSGLADVALVMSDTVTYDDEGNTLSFTPAVLSFEKYITPSGKDAYRKYASLATQLEHAALGVQWVGQPNTTTQNTRKRVS